MKFNIFNIIRYNLFCGLLVILFTVILASCSDDIFLYDSDNNPEGETEFMVSVDYKAFSGVALEANSRASNGENFDGKALKKIESLWVVAYKKSGDNWILSEQSPIEITVAKHGLKTEEVENIRPDGKPQAEEKTWRASFKMSLDNGVYRMYAVANCDLSSIDRSKITTPDGLKSLPLTWNSDKLSDNSEMFGILSEDEGFTTEDVNVTVKPGNQFHAWIRRAASKVTVGFDTSNLLDGIDIYLKSVSVRDIPRVCYLGQDNTPGAEERDISSDLISVGSTLYFTGANENSVNADYKNWRKVSKETGYWGYRSEMDNQSGTPDNITERKAWEHDEVTDALYLYENKQGVSWKDKSQSVASPNNGWGWTDDIGYPDPVEGEPDSGWKDCMAYGSYIEVEAYYVSKVKGREQEGPIKYRFMLGRDAAKDYNTDRNCHFKLTLKFNGMANDADWHVDYKAPVLTVTEPHVFDYRGQVFYQDIDIPNWGNTFKPENEVIVRSYEGNDYNQQYLDIKVEYKVVKDDGTEEWVENSDWLSYEITAGSSDTEKKVNFKATSKPKKVKIADRLAANDAKGTTSRYNLSHPKGTANTISETANTYIVDAKGYYILPLIYGNGYTDGGPNSNSYKYSGSGTGASYLSTFKNHRNVNITDVVIKNNTGCTPKDAVLVWQDEQDLVKNISLDMTAFGGTGGLRFDVLPDAEGKMREGNAVLAVRDQSDQIMWSWQIWVTCLDFNYPAEGYVFDETIPVTGYRYAGIYNLLPVNLGWCSEGKDIIIYPSRKCDVRISNGRMSEEITIHQASHLAFPCGNNPYYQWGRKDPFIAGLAGNKNKTRYTPSGTLTTNPQRLYDDEVAKGFFPNATRQTTRNALHLMIQHPDIWHNPPRTISGIAPVSNNETYDNLWCGTAVGNANVRYKTIYDPCPPGYSVPNRFAFSGFTDAGNNINYSSDESLHNRIWDVRQENVGEGCYTDGVYEFYTDSRKIQSICFPMTGYRDWDDQSKLYWMKERGYVWENERPTTFTETMRPCYAHQFLFSKEHKEVLPSDSYISTDGFPVRPVKIK